MRTLYVRTLSSFLALVLSLTLGAFAAYPQAKPKSISPADQRALEALFKGVDPSKYRLHFTRTVGRKNVEMRDLEQVSKIRNPGEAAGWIILIVEGKDVIYVLAVGKDELESVIGKEKAAKLNQIMGKYAR